MMHAAAVQAAPSIAGVLFRANAWARGLIVWTSLVVVPFFSMAPQLDAADLHWTLTNPTERSYANEPVRLKIDLPASATAGEYRVEAAGTEVASQVSDYGGRKSIWVAASLDAEQAIDFAVRRQASRCVAGAVSVRQQGDELVLDNGAISVRLPAELSDSVPPVPILAVRPRGGPWAGAGHWRTARRCRGFRATVLDEGPVVARVRLRYDFEGSAGLWDDVASFAQVDVSLWAGQRHALVEESHEMDRGDYWEFDAAAGWQARQAIAVTYGHMPAHGGPEVRPPTTLRTGQTRMGDTLLNLQARWSQSYDEGWLFACHDGRFAIGAIPVHAARWHWPHNNLIEVKVQSSGDYAGLRCPTWKGRRAWFLIAGLQQEWEEKAAKEYVVRHAFQSLDKLHQDYTLDWPGLDELLAGGNRRDPKPGRFQGFDFYSSWMNPSSMLRGFGRRLMGEAGSQGNRSDLTQAQVFLDPDSYGSYWNYWSPENPNFFTDYHRCGILLVTKLKNHPQFHDFCRLAEQKFHEDLYHAITLPGGAGQECPGYVAYAMSSWAPLADICRQHLGFDPAKWPRYGAGASFLLHVSQPIGGGQRRCHPGGDTHPPGPDVFEIAAAMGVREDVRKFTTEELPGFGVVFRNRPGTDQETYLAFKSGPNRGHYHGDSLSFHYCANARPVAIDHMCSYAPRAGQEHMHNRVAFHTDQLPYANMDGFERVIALKTSADADVAIGQVESERLRATTEYPPEQWDTYLPEQRFDQLLQYRRTIVGLKNRGQDYFVIRDQHAGPRVHATWCLHVLSDRCDRSGNRFDFGNLTVVCAAPPAFDFAGHDWDFEKQDKSGNRILRETTKGIRLTVAGDSSEFITVLYPGSRTPEIAPLENGVRVGDDEITFDGGIDQDEDTTYVSVRRGGKAVMALTGREIDLDRSQGEIGLFVPDAGYPFGEIPDWLIRQRAAVPDWAPDWARGARRYELRRQ